MSRYNLAGNTITPPTPFYHYDLGLLRRTLQVAIASAASHNYIVHYAMKANVDSRLLEIIAAAGMGADCVSGWEVEAALKAGFPAQKIVFAGVAKSDAEIEYALRNDIFAFNCESLEELEVINLLAKQMGKTARVALRMNPNVKPDTHAYISTGHGHSKFGIAYTEVDEALRRLEHMANIRIVGLHFHIGSQILGMDFFEDLARRATEICGWFEAKGMTIEHLNMGGGLGIDYDRPDKHPIPDFEGFFSAFGCLPKDKKIHFELGRALVGQCGEVVTRVLFTKTTSTDANYILTDAGMTELIRPALYGAHHAIENLSAGVGDGRDRKSGIYCIGGPICESSDVFAHEIEFPNSYRGDLLTIRSAGAYGAVMSSNYNLRPTAKVYYSED